MTKAKVHSHTTRWHCQSCGYIFTHASIKRAGEGEARPDECPECGSEAVTALEEGRT